VTLAGTGSSTTSTTAAGTTSTGLDPTTTDTTAGETTTTIDPSSTTTATQPGTPTTRSTPPPTRPTVPTVPPTVPPTRPTTPTTRPTTTTTAVPQVSFTVSNSPRTSANWYVTGPMATQASVLTWAVTPSAGFTVEVTGPPTTDYSNPLSPQVIPFTKTTPTGSQAVCPGATTNGGSGRLCGVDNGSYAYTITVRNAAGQVLVTQTATLTVNAPPVP
jgi:hypothetical protein